MNNITRNEAIDSGSLFYFTGKPCKYGHVSKRRVVNCMCYDCEVIAGKKKSGYKKEWYQKNRDRLIERSASHYLNNIDKKRQYASQYQKDNLGKIIEKRKQRIKSDPVYAAKERVRCLIKETIRNYGSSKKCLTSEILGCSTAEFKDHLEKQFTKGMGWKNASDWHIDHIIPISSAKTEDDILALNHHTNLRPMWARDNLIKSNKMEYLI